MSSPSVEWNASTIRAFRHELKLSQRRFGLLVGIGESTIEHLERNRRPAGRYVCRRLSLAQAQYLAGALDLAWLNWNHGARSSPEKRRRAVKRIARPDPVKAKPRTFRARITFTLEPGRKQARIHRDLATLRITDVSAVSGLADHIRASIAEYLDRLHSPEGFRQPQPPRALTPEHGQLLDSRSAGARSG